MSKHSEAYDEAIESICSGVGRLMSAASDGAAAWTDSNVHVAAMNCATSVWSQLNAQTMVDVTAHRIELPKHVKDAIRDRLGITDPAQPDENPPAGKPPAEEFASSPGL